MTDKLVIVDRDGVINYDSDTYIKSLEEWQPIEGSIDALARLSLAGFTIAVATNQSGLARGYFDEYTLARIHSTLSTLVEDQGGLINGIFYCPHLPKDNCNCRKPATGLLEQIETELAVSVNQAWFIGDSTKDIETAMAKNCRPVLVLTGKGLITQSELSPALLATIPVFENLFAAAMFILGTHD